MLFGPIVFMKRTLRGQCITFVIVFILKLNLYTSLQIPRGNKVRPPDDFEGFLEELGTMVYKSRKPQTRNDLRGQKHTTPSYKNYRRQQVSKNTLRTQKSALGDMLMMKLVSYYEDKYKLTHLDSTTTESITMRRSGYGTGKFDNVGGGLFDTIRPQHVHYAGSARRMEHYSEDEDIPEVVIL